MILPGSGAMIPTMVKLPPILAARIDAAAKAGESRPATIRRLVEERLDAAALGGLTAEEIDTLRRASAALNPQRGLTSGFSRVE